VHGGPLGACHQCVCYLPNSPSTVAAEQEGVWCGLVRTAAAQHKLELLCGCTCGPGRKIEACGCSVNCSVFRFLLFVLSTVCYVGQQFVVWLGLSGTYSHSCVLCFVGWSTMFQGSVVCAVMLVLSVVPQSMCVLAVPYVSPSSLLGTSTSGA
jgi:hypothetical protein